MREKSESANRPEPDPHGIPPSAVYSEPWWRGIGYNPIPPTLTGGNATNSSSPECLNGGSESNDGQSLSNGGLNEHDDNAIKESQTTVTSRSDGNYHQEHQNLQFAAPTLPRGSDDCLTQPPQLELVSHSIACASNPYQDPYYGGMMAAYGPQPVVHPHLLATHHARMPLPLEMTQEPVYVNAKQYRGILRRRESRAKAELKRKLIKARKPYLHESRHQHAMRRARGSGGRFAKKVDGDASNHKAEEKGTGSGSAISSQSVSSSGSEPLPSDSAETWNPSNSQQARGSPLHNISEAHTYSNGSGQYHNNGGLQASTCNFGGERRGRRLFRPAMGKHLIEPGFTEAPSHPVNPIVGGWCPDGRPGSTQAEKREHLVTYFLVTIILQGNSFLAFFLC
ncbi:hypothetical protein L1049_018827 [Liquidambar formosana]|uniref:Nuclear transcription factor Y subunit n=1 Tax=Liquidambar formosana TaxID=63359 RepID=A0AAP0WMQ7_LIQFO